MSSNFDNFTDKLEGVTSLSGAGNLETFTNNWFVKKFWGFIRWCFNPVVVFITLQFIWIGMTTMWIVWFAEKNEQITKLAESFGSEYFDSRYALWMLVIGCILLGMMSFGMIVLFISNQKQGKLVRQQRSFVSSVTHELRSPLSSLQLTFETMRSRELDEETTNKLMEMAGEDIQRLSRLVNQILVSARLDRGLAGFEDKKEIFSLSEILNKVGTKLDWLDPKIPDRLSISCDDKIKIRSAPAIVTLIISNLIENAIKYSPRETPINIAVEQSKEKVNIFVKDLGFGITKPDQKQIFKMFYRGKISGKKAISGTGLGLFMVRSLTLLLGGKIEVLSEGVNQGSTFVVTLPTGTK